ncbi:MAG: addiction module protein [Inhella sp.]
MSSHMPPELRALSLAERLQLVEDVWDSIVEDSAGELPVSEAQREELRRRLAAHEAHPEQAVPWEQVRAALFKTGATERLTRAAHAHRLPP